MTIVTGRPRELDIRVCGLKVFILDKTLGGTSKAELYSTVDGLVELAAVDDLMNPTIELKMIA